MMSEREASNRDFLFGWPISPAKRAIDSSGESSMYEPRLTERRPDYPDPESLPVPLPLFVPRPVFDRLKAESKHNTCEIWEYVIEILRVHTERLNSEDSHHDGRLGIDEHEGIKTRA